MLPLLRYLNEPVLVSKVQKYFGVQSLDVKRRRRKSKKSTTDKDDRQTSKSSTLANGFVKPEEDYDDRLSSGSESEPKNYVITNKFWYYLFILGTELGDEVFYAVFIPFWFWNVDGAVGRRVVMVWAVVMYVGQLIKDLLCWPRPSSPVFRLQKKWVLEYGMPSTHAMVGISIPFSVILYTYNRYLYSVPLGIAFATVWCTVICVSRLYLGMHTVLDIIVGVVLALILMVPLVPLVDALDIYLLTSRWSPVILIVLSISILYFYPKGDMWTPTRGDTTLVVSVCVGIHVGAWTNYQLGQMTEASMPPPYSIIWPSYEMIGLSLLRTVLGFSSIVATRALCKSASYATVCFLLRLNSSEIRESAHTCQFSPKSTVEICYKYITYILLGFNTLYLLPNAFKLLRIERPTFYTEI